MPELLSIDEALDRILARAQPLTPEVVPLDQGAGRILAEAALAVVDLPPFPSSAMDGFAVRVEDTPGTLPIAARVAAGRPAPGPLIRGTAAAIATGGVVPEGAGVRLGSAQIGALAAAGVAEICCGRRPRVAVLATGSELRSPGGSLAPGEIFESNRPMIAAALSPMGADVEVLPAVADDEDAHRAALERGLEADVLVTSGGVSMGPHDLVRRIAAELGVEEVFWGVAVKPGKPLSFGVRGDTLVFGLPGNPVSSLVASYVFVGPALLALQGAAEPGPTYGVGRTRTSLVRNAHRDEFVRARRTLDEAGVLLEPVSGQESHMIVRAAFADALVHVPRGGGEIAAGDSVRYLGLA